jgi:propanol-preferring alcohol dehydrogenase
MRVEAPYLMRLPDELSFVDGAILACQGGTAYAPLVRMGVSGRDVLVVSGLGPVGLLSVVFGKALGATIVGIDPSPGRRVLGEKLGAVFTIDPAEGNVAEQLRARFPDGADKLTETSGATAAHEVMGGLVKPYATIAIVGGGSPELVMPLRHLTGPEATVIGSSAYSPVQFPELCAFVTRHNVDLPSVVSETFGLKDGVEAFRIAADANTGKVMFRFD